MMYVYGFSILFGLWFNHRAKRAGNVLGAWLGLAPLAFAAWHYMTVTAWS